MKLDPLMKLTVAIVESQKVGPGPRPARAPSLGIEGGKFEGPRLRGTVLDGGDWTLLRPDGVLELDLRVTLRTDDGALIQMSSFGLRHGPPEVLAALAKGETVDPARYYFRTTPRFETAAPGYLFLNRHLCRRDGRSATGQPTIYTIDEIL